MTENNTENKKSSKELWLVLIFVDIIALCVFSYFIYASFMNNGQKTVQIKRDVKTNDIFLEEVNLAEPVKKETPKEPIKEIKPEKEPEVKTVQEGNKLPAKEIQETRKETAPVQQIAQKEDKQSYIISGTGKWRKVIFRYFDDAKEVAIVSGFTMRKPQTLKKIKGVWETTLTIAPGTYKYMFIIDGQEVKDPYNKQEESGRSVIVIK